MIKLIVFDIGGVLVKFDEKQYIEYISKKLNVDAHEFSAVINPMINSLERGNMTLPHMLHKLSTRYKRSPSEFEWGNALKHMAQSDAKTQALLNRLSKRYSVVLLTNVSRSRYSMIRRMMLKNLKYKRAFVSCYMRVVKPDPRIYTRVLKKMHVKPSESVFIDNMRINTEGARHVGMYAIHFTGYASLVKRLRNLGIAV